MNKSFKNTKRIISSIILIIMLISSLSACFCKHEFGEWSVMKESTCIENGTENRKCNLCDVIEEREISTLAEHTYGDWNETKKATCTEEGEKEQKCNVCQKIQTEIIAIIEHDWEKATCTSPKTCNSCGETEGNELGHSWKDATCAAPTTCRNCGKTEGSSLEHSWTDATCTSPEMCTKCYKTEGSALGHSWKDATCSSPKKCKTCGKTEGTALKHNSNSKGKCKYCGKKMTAKDFDYLAGTDFRRIRSSYSSATAQAAYVIAFTNLDGDFCVLTHVRYQIVSNYSETTLHNITTGKYITDPADYYDSLAYRAWGDSRIHYMDLESEVRKYELYAMQGVVDMLSKGSHSGAGAFVDASRLNM